MTSIVRKKMASHEQPNSLRNGKYSISFDNSKFETLIIGDNNTVNDHRSGRSTASSQESSTIHGNGESLVTKGERVNMNLKNDSRDTDKASLHCIGPESIPVVSVKRDREFEESVNGFPVIWKKLHIVRMVFLMICMRARQWQF